MMYRIRKRVLLLFTISIGILFTCNFIHAQNWPKVYGDNIHSLIKNLNESYDKGFYLTAFTYDNQGFNEFGWIIKIDINGNILWDKKFGDGNDRNWFGDSFVTTDHGLIISGVTTKYSAGDFDPTFIKLNVCGEIEWCQVLHSPDQNYATGIIQIANGSFIGMLQYYGEGENYARISLVKMDQTGDPIWIKPLAQEDTLIYNEEGNYLYLTNDSNYLVSGEAYHPGKHPFWIVADTQGMQVWDLFWNSLVGQAHQIVEKDTGIFYSTGWGIGSGRPQSPVLLKFDSDGNPKDMNFLMGDTISGGSSSGIDYINDSNLIIGIAWKSTSTPPQNYSEVILSDTNGVMSIRRLLLNEYQVPNITMNTSDNKILVAGNYVTDGNWDIYLWKMNTDLEDDTLYTQPLTYDSLCPYEIQSDTVELDCGLFVNIDEIPTKEEYESTIKISPNPARDWIVLTFSDIWKSEESELVIYNIFGQEVMKTRAVVQNRSVSLNVSGLSSGVYLVTCNDTKQRGLKGKFVIAR